MNKKQLVKIIEKAGGQIYEEYAEPKKLLAESEGKQKPKR